MYLADNSIFLTVATILSVFDISKGVDQSGNVIEPEVDFSGFIRYDARLLLEKVTFIHSAAIQSPSSVSFAPAQLQPRNLSAIRSFLVLEDGGLHRLHLEGRP